MKFLISCFVFVITSFYINAQRTSVSVSTAQSPLASYDAEWNNPEYEKCNTAANENYLSNKEKTIIYILNLIRNYPDLFAETVLSKYPERTGQKNLHKDKYFQTLVDTLSTFEYELHLLYPDNLCYESAACHALKSGQLSYTGHERKSAECKQKKHFLAECCNYGDTEPLEIVVSLLIDQGIPSLDHRFVMLGDYDKIGVSIKPHKKFMYNTVMDFY